jgi:hypothetical protein
VAASAPVTTLPSGSLFKVNRMPLARYGSRTFLSDRPTLADREPTAEQLEFVAALNRKFKGLRGELQADFRAYCGGAAGFVVRRFAPSCAPQDDADVLTKYRPIGMGPKGLEKYFTKHFGISWATFLGTPSDELRTTLRRSPEPKKDIRSTRQTGKTTAEHTVRKKPRPAGRPASQRPAERPTQKRTSARVTSTGHAAKASSKAKVTANAAAPKRQPAPAKRQPSTPPVKHAAAKATSTDPSLDQAERDMAELKALLTQAIKN